MIDKTTAGITAEPEEVEAVLHNLCGYHLAERDPAFRYSVLTREQVLYEALVQAIKRERGRALADLVAAGNTLTQVAQKTNLGSRQRVQRMIAISKAAQEAAAAVQAASREFEAKLAAVEATLDEVVSGTAGASAAPGASVSSADVPDGGVSSADVTGASVSSAGVTGEPPLVPAPRLPLHDLSDTTVEAGLLVRSALVEPTRVLPAVGSFFHPDSLAEAGEEPARDEEARWWRRGRDTGAA